VLARLRPTRWYFVAALLIPFARDAAGSAAWESSCHFLFNQNHAGDAQETARHATGAPVFALAETYGSGGKRLQTTSAMMNLLTLNALGALCPIAKVEPAESGPYGRAPHDQDLESN
jgi:hypothetical protein